MTVVSRCFAKAILAFVPFARGIAAGLILAIYATMFILFCLIVYSSALFRAQVIVAGLSMALFCVVVGMGGKWLEELVEWAERKSN